MARTKPFESKYRQDEKRAIIAAIVDHGLSAPAAVAAAEAGTLPGIGAGLAPFAFAQTYARDLAAEERRRRRQLEVSKSDPGQLLGEHLADLIVMLERDRRRAQEDQRKRRLKPGTLIDLARAGIAIDSLARQLNGPKRPSNGKPAGPERPAGFLEGLAQNAS